MTRIGIMTLDKYGHVSQTIAEANINETTVKIGYDPTDRHPCPPDEVIPRSVFNRRVVQRIDSTQIYVKLD